MTGVRCGGPGHDTTGEPAKRCANGDAVIVNLGSDCFCTKICLCRMAAACHLSATLLQIAMQLPNHFKLVIHVRLGFRPNDVPRLTFTTSSYYATITCRKFFLCCLGLAASVSVWKLPPSLPEHYAAVIKFDSRVIARAIALQALTFVGKREHCRQCRSRMLPPSTHAKEKT